jgi:hypothetical protein
MAIKFIHLIDGTISTCNLFLQTLIGLPRLSAFGANDDVETIGL